MVRTKSLSLRLPANCLWIIDRTDLHLQNCLVLTTLLHRDSLPANCQGTDLRKWTNQQICLAPTPLLLSNRLPVNHPLHLPDHRASPAWTPTLRVTFQTEWISLLWGVNGLTRIQMPLSQTLTRHFLTNITTERLLERSSCTRGGRTSRIWILDKDTSSVEDNPFAGPKSQPTGQVSVCMLSDDRL